MKITFYPKTDRKPEDSGYTPEEIRRSYHWIYADVTCSECGKVQSVAQIGGLGGYCIRCGSKQGE